MPCMKVEQFGVSQPMRDLCLAIVHLREARARLCFFRLFLNHTSLVRGLGYHLQFQADEGSPVLMQAVSLYSPHSYHSNSASPL
jgi:hypothetical protein